MTNKHAYIFVRTDISIPQIAVQACHAAWEAARHHASPSIVLIGVKNGRALRKAIKLLETNYIKCYPFREPFMNNMMTAVCTEPLYPHERELLKDYKLWSG